MTKANNKNELFRLAAVLYADNNYEVSTKTIHKKIIDSALLDCENSKLTKHALIDFIDEKYSLIISEDEITEIINNNPESYKSFNNKGSLKFCLSSKRKKVIENKIRNKNIDFFIDNFCNKKENAIKIKNLIYGFLYHMFSVNTASFQKLIDKDKDISKIISIQDFKYNNEEIETINEFLNWDDEEKNKSIFDISSYALEFCLLTNKKGTKNFKLNNLKNKTFYLDTNVIYRALGINGDDRKRRTKTFLDKFNEAGEKLHITKITDTEFKNSIKFYIDKLKKVQNPKVSSKVFLEFKSLRSINSFYHSWKKGKVNHNLDIFEGYIINEYNLLLDRLKIEIDYKVPYDSENKETQEHLNDLYSSINKDKPIEKQNNINSIYNDAENILWIEKKRQGKVLNIFDTSYFFISTDNQLRKWDYYRNNSTPIVLLPSQWMSVLLRYFDRTKDDYKSFVSFLNLRNNEKLIEGEKLDLVLSGISEMTTDVEQQRYLVSTLIEKGFQNVIGKTLTNEEIISQSKFFAKTELEKIVNELSNKVDNLKDIQTTQNKKLENALSIKSKMSSKLIKKSSESKNLQSIAITQEVQLELRKWRQPLFYLIPLAILFIIFYLSMLVLKNNPYNLSVILLKHIDSIESESLKNILNTVIALPLGFIGWVTIYCHNRYSNSKVDDKKNQIIEKLKKKYKENYL